jgi:protein TonB
MTKLSNFSILLLILFSGNLFSQNVPPPIGSKDEEDLIFEKVEIEASYPGGITAWRKFLEKTLKPEVPVNNGAPAGYYTVLVRFIVSKTGEVAEIKAITNLGYGMEEEVIRTLKKAGKWQPGEQNNRIVNSYHT